MTTNPTNGIAIRLAEPGDIDRILELVAQYCEADDHPFHEHLARPPVVELTASDRWGRIWLAVQDPDREDGTVVGYLALTWGYGIEAGGMEAVIDELYVEPKGEGVGSALMERATEDCRQRGVRRIFLETELANNGARRLYGRLGYRADDSIWMEKWLVGPES